MQYEIDLKLGKPTLERLVEEGFSLQIFKGVNNVAKNSAKVSVWKSVEELLELNTIKWEEAYAGYFTATVLKDDAVIEATDFSSLKLGDLYTLNKDGEGVVSKGERSDSFNYAMEQQRMPKDHFHCGLGSIADKKLSPFVAISIAPQFFVELEPHEKILLMFSQQPREIGTITVQSESKAILIDFPTNNRKIELSFDENKGWLPSDPTDPRVTFYNTPVNIANEVCD